jgi:hypothetical protein
LKIEKGVGQMTITPLFSRLNETDKRLVCIAAFMWCADKDQNVNDELLLIDVQTGQKAGTFSLIGGLNEK